MDGAVDFEAIIGILRQKNGAFGSKMGKNEVLCYQFIDYNSFIISELLENLG